MTKSLNIGKGKGSTGLHKIKDNMFINSTLVQCSSCSNNPINIWNMPWDLDRLTPRSKCEKCQKEYNANYFQENKEVIKTNSKKWKTKNAEKKKKTDKIYRDTHKEETRQWRKDNKIELSIKRTIKHKHRLNTDPIYFLVDRLEKNTLKHLRKITKSKKETKVILKIFDVVLGWKKGSHKNFINRVSRKINSNGFLTIEEYHNNTSKYNIDHIVPVCWLRNKLGEAKTSREKWELLVMVLNYRNLRVITADANLEKGGKVNPEDKKNMLEFWKRNKKQMNQYIKLIHKYTRKEQRKHMTINKLIHFVYGKDNEND